MTAHHLPIEDDKPCQQPRAPNSVIDQLSERLTTLSYQLESAVVVKLVAGTASCHADFDLRFGIEDYIFGDVCANSTGARASPMFVTGCRPSFYTPNSIRIRYAHSFIHPCTLVSFTMFLLTSLTTRLARAEVNRVEEIRRRPMVLRVRGIGHRVRTPRFCVGGMEV